MFTQDGALRPIHDLPEELAAAISSLKIDWPKQRLLLELGRNFIAIPSRKHQDAICSLVRALAEPDAEH